MLRISNVNIPENKKLPVALSYIYGIGRPLADKIIHHLKIDRNKKAGQLTAEEIVRLRDFIEKNYKVEGDLKRLIQGNIKRLKEVSAYRGLRHIRGLPARGQRTKTNSRTRRGNVRKTVGSGRKKSSEKT
ncbi:30S ribosomal protein S13 [Candidatus Azambacteria bacterium RIFOXYD1_FULL_42_11]|uniref:Small ribosomal subunit protein uS13 n=4 Tax=Candidatus Azamiibacteriota TaxID=1752741 RepID=A0A0G1CAA0_9BACT|nr:MAG: 30S ribosomal protein S13 [Candidatus Azambacteria bacterium GW2011_GWB1_42_17]KKS46568.1 MAG: 30S ribosomal protein S13 [Candidatus Azambacteria bacterium GW2011_GWA1_42_19]KKS76068.1 MAG: 30S ribosomal protein S13 [Candidatus Azambacteria bacterium GW2011_GWA2_42_9]KKS88874.1 MAG: 30S ribosomal protein S13 [Parcubacteria group bacterium GW2011_GWC1_43_11]OGD43149.1 MAG: 30S ribosomal protein S13 [Candidatus Azambacteria bacterium RIFOXYD1_FULL_42_11]